MSNCKNFISIFVLGLLIFGDLHAANTYRYKFNRYPVAVTGTSPDGSKLKVGRSIVSSKDLYTPLLSIDPLKGDFLSINSLGTALVVKRDWTKLEGGISSAIFNLSGQETPIGNPLHFRNEATLLNDSGAFILKVREREDSPWDKVYLVNKNGQTELFSAGDIYINDLKGSKLAVGYRDFTSGIEPVIFEEISPGHIVEKFITGLPVPFQPGYERCEAESVAGDFIAGTCLHHDGLGFYKRIFRFNMVTQALDFLDRVAAYGKLYGNVIVRADGSVTWNGAMDTPGHYLAVAEAGKSNFIDLTAVVEAAVGKTTYAQILDRDNNGGFIVGYENSQGCTIVTCSGRLKRVLVP